MVLSPPGKQIMFEVGESIKAGSKIGSLEHPFKNIYHLGDMIASGSFGTVYRTHHRMHLNDMYAVKVIESCYPGSAEEEETIHEAEIMRALNDVKHVIKLIDLYVHDYTMYIVQDLAEGGDVFDALSKRERYTEHDAWALAKTLVSTIGKIHECKIVHRDLKPENLLLRDNSRFAEVLVCDFGMAKSLQKGRLISFCGSPAYVAPEIVERCEYDEKVDMWSIGCILYLLLSGQYPFGTEDECDLLYQSICAGDYNFEDEAWDYVSGGAKRVISNLLKHKPEERWSAEDVMDSNWIQRSSFVVREEGKSSKNELSQSLQNIQLRCARRKVKAAIYAVKFSNKTGEMKSSSSVVATTKKKGIIESKPDLEYNEDDELMNTVKNINDAFSGKNRKYNLNTAKRISLSPSPNTTPIDPKGPKEDEAHSRKPISWQKSNTSTKSMGNSSSITSKVKNIGSIFGDFKKKNTFLKQNDVQNIEYSAITSAETTTSRKHSFHASDIMLENQIYSNNTERVNEAAEVGMGNVSESNENRVRTSRRIIGKEMDDLSERSRNSIWASKKIFDKQGYKSKETKNKNDKNVKGSKTNSSSSSNNRSESRKAQHDTLIESERNEFESNCVSGEQVIGNRPGRRSHGTGGRLSLSYIPESNEMELNFLAKQTSDDEIDDSPFVLFKNKEKKFNKITKLASKKKIATWNDIIDNEDSFEDDIDQNSGSCYCEAYQYQDHDNSNEDETESSDFFSCRSTGTSYEFDCEHSRSYSINDLRNDKHKIERVDYKNIEQYLTDEDFHKVFDGATRADVITWKPWKKQYYKKRAQIW